MVQILHVLRRQYLAFGRGPLEAQGASAQKAGCPKLPLSGHKERDGLLSFLSTTVWHFIPIYIRLLSNSETDSFCVSATAAISVAFSTAHVSRAPSKYIPPWPSKRDHSPCSENLGGQQETGYNLLLGRFLVLSNHVSLEILVIPRWSICHDLQCGIVLATDSC